MVSNNNVRIGEKMVEIDPDTGLEHISPIGLAHQKKRDYVNKYYTSVHMRHFIVRLHQEAFPELAEEMSKAGKNANGHYSVFLALLPLKLAGKLTPEIQQKIMDIYNVVE